MITVGETLKETEAPIGKSVNRVDGKLKVTGGAKYAGEFFADGLVHGVIVNGTIPRGKIVSIDTSAALAVPGVLQVFTHENRPRTAWFDRKWKDDDAVAGSPFRPLYDDEILFSGQPIALVVADTFETARYAARLVEVTYKSTEFSTDIEHNKSDAREPKKGKGGYEPPPPPRGDAAAAIKGATHSIRADYHQPAEHHNPMELFSTTAVYNDDGTLTVYDKTQGAQNSHKYITNVFGLAKEQVKVVSPFVGGGFGSGLRPQHQLFLSVMAATELKRPVRVVMSRQQMFTFGHRPETGQTLEMAAGGDGTLSAVVHSAWAETSRFEDYCEVVVNWSGQQYQCDNVTLDYKVVPVDLHTPLDMRAPGAVTGEFALECAIDEIAEKVGMDPLEFRLKNYAETDQNKKKPFSSKELRACYRQGAEKFGWSKRNAEPRSMRDGKHLIGYGMATSAWDAMQQTAAARAVLGLDGKLVVGSCTADIGTGTYTAMTIVAAAALGLAVEDVTFKLGDSTLPTAPIEGGSWTVSSVGSAVKAACDKVADQLVTAARKDKTSPFYGLPAADLELAGGSVRSKSDPLKARTIAEVMRSAGLAAIDVTETVTPNLLKQMPYSRATYAACFVEVKVDERLGTVGVSRVVSAVAAGRIISRKTATSQVSGAVVWGMGMALQEETVTDHRLGRYMNHNLSEYHVPVLADVGAIDVIFVEEKDEVVNPLGAKGVGEIGLVGVAGAIANAVYHATGKRVRDLPIRLDKLL